MPSPVTKMPKSTIAGAVIFLVAGCDEPTVPPTAPTEVNQSAKAVPEPQYTPEEEEEFMFGSNDPKPKPQPEAKLVETQKSQAKIEEDACMADENCATHALEALAHGNKALQLYQLGDQSGACAHAMASLSSARNFSDKPAMFQIFLKAKTHLCH